MLHLIFQKKIGLLALFILVWGYGWGQTEGMLLPVSNKLLLNPSFAGINKNTRIGTSIGFFSESEQKLNHDFHFSWDTYSPKLKGGVALSFFQGLYGAENTNTIGAGFTYSRPFPVKAEKKLIAAFNLNYRVAAAQWFAYAIQKFPGQYGKTSDATPEPFQKAAFLRPGVGFLWSSHGLKTGISAWWSQQKGLARNEKNWKSQPADLLFYFTQTIHGNKNGLTSQPFRTVPEVILLYTREQFISRSGVFLELRDRTCGLFLQNNYTRNLHGIGGTYGRKFLNYDLRISAGTALGAGFQRPVFFGEIALNLIIPLIPGNKKNPWAPPE